MKFGDWYSKNYKKTLILPAVLIVLSVIYIAIFYSQTGSFFYMDVSLTGGTSFSVQTNYSQSDMEKELSKNFDDFTVKAVSDGSGNQIQLIITAPESESDAIQGGIEEILGFKLSDENSSIEFTSSGLSKTFLDQLLIAIILAFFWMGCVVFIIFGKGGKIKFWLIVANLLFAVFLGNFFMQINPIISWIIFGIFSVSLIFVYLKKSVPSFAVILSAFSNILMTLAVVDLMGLRLSGAGIVSFLMLIGYSVDTDTMLITKLSENNKAINHTIFESFKTGLTMTCTSIIAVVLALFVVYPYGTVLNQIFIVLSIGLTFDLFNTWVTNTAILKWYFSKKREDKK